MSSRRARGRGNSRGGRQQNVRNQQMDSNGPGGRIRGTPQQVLDRYLALARDASSAGDSVLAENLWQHAEHYARMLNAATPPQQQNQQHQGNGRDDQSYDDADGDGDGDGNQADQSVNAQQDRPQQERPPQERPRQRRSAAANNEPSEPKGEPEEQPAAPAPPPEWTGGEQQADGEQPASPPRRRRRSRFQRQQEQDGGDTASAQPADAGDDSSDTNPVPPIDLSAAVPEPAPSEKPREPGEQPLV
jgi:hypothetical protein